MRLLFVVNNLIVKGKTSDVVQRMASGAFWSFSGTAIAKFIVLIAGIFCARILDKDEYGEFGMVRSTINMFIVFGVAGLGLTATKYISEYKEWQKERVSSIYLLTNGFAFVTGLAVAIIIIVFAPELANNTLHSPQLINDIRIGALLLFVSVINAAQTGTLSGLENFKGIALNTLKGSIAEAIGMLLGAYYWGVTGAILGYGIGFIVLYVTNHFSIRQSLKERDISIHWSSFQKKDLELLYKFSLPAALSSIMVMPVFWIVRSMLVRANGFGELAIYEAADQWKVIILFIPSAVSQIVLPILSSIVHIDRNKFWKVVVINIGVNASIALVLAIIVSLLGNSIMGLYGDDYDNVTPLVYLSLSTIFTSISSVIGLTIASKAKMWVGFSFNLVWAVMLICFSYFFLRLNMGASGIALAILCAYVIHALAQFTYLMFSLKND